MFSPSTNYSYKGLKRRNSKRKVASKFDNFNQINICILICSCHYWQSNHRNGLLFKFQSRSLIKQIVFRSIRSQAQKV